MPPYSLTDGAERASMMHPSESLHAVNWQLDTIATSMGSCMQLGEFPANPVAYQPTQDGLLLSSSAYQTPAYSLAYPEPEFVKQEPFVQTAWVCSGSANECAKHC
jgi:hypothetical protein